MLNLFKLILLQVAHGKIYCSISIFFISMLA